MAAGSTPCIGSLAVAVPPYVAGRDEAIAFFRKHYSGRLSSRNLSLMEKLLAHPSISKRNFALTDPDCLVDERPDDKVARFTEWAIELSAEAAGKALQKAEVSADSVSAIVVNTCTGYICPGISTFLIEKLGLPRRIKAFDLVGSGCGGAIPNLQAASSLLNGGADEVVLSLSVEICSATFQMENELSLIVSNALFGDGAAAAVLWGRPEGLALLASSSRYYPEHREHIRYVHRNGQLYNKLSTTLPRLVRKAVADVVGDILRRTSLRKEDITHWAFHTGGEKVIDDIKAELELSERDLAPTRDILSKFGNMSSPTVWFVLENIMSGNPSRGDRCMMVAFGAGLSAHACLLEKI